MTLPASQPTCGRGADNRLLGNVRFLGFYLVGGIASTMASLFWRRLRGDHTTSSEGASGAIYSCMGTSILLSLSRFTLFSFRCFLTSPNSPLPDIPATRLTHWIARWQIAFFAAMFPQTQFLLFFVVPMPAWLFAGGIFAVSPLLLSILSVIHIVKDPNTVLILSTTSLEHYTAPTLLPIPLDIWVVS